MQGMVWEMKSPTGETIRPLERIIHRAVKQSPNIIIDLRRSRISDSTAANTVQKLFLEMRSVRNLWIITKKLEIIKLKK